MALERKRGPRKTLRVTFPDGKIVCYSNATSVMINVLKKIGAARFPEIDLEMGHYPLLSQEYNPKFKEYLKPVCDGWLLNTQSDTATKFIQLKAINKLLDLNLKIEIGSDFKTEDNPYKGKKTRTIPKLLVKLPNGEFVGNDKSIDTFLETIWNLGIENIFRKEIEWHKSPLITNYKKFEGQIQVDKDRWIQVPGQTKEMVKLLKIISIYLRTNIEVCLI